MNKPIRNAGIAAIVYILTVMWVVQDVVIDAPIRFVIALGFFVTVGLTYGASGGFEDN